MITIYYTATTLDGYLADEEDSLHWLFKQDQDADGALSYAEFIQHVGAVCMGSTTYEWVLPHLTDGWAYEQPSWVFTTRELPTVEGDVRFVRGDVGPVHDQMVAAAGDKDVWVVGGGDLAAQFAEAGLLDRMLLSVAPVTLGAGRPLFPRPFDLRLVDLARNGAFACLTYDVVGPLERGPENPGNL
jgi:dihydrofolate reductase